jgi:hypothetical protein
MPTPPIDPVTTIKIRRSTRDRLKKVAGFNLSDTYDTVIAGLIDEHEKRGRSK